MIRSTLLLLFLAAAIALHAAEPTLRRVFDIHAICGDALNLGAVPGGKRIVIPIKGGKVYGQIKAEIIPGGADYQKIDTITGRTEFQAIYSLKTDDGTIINVKNTGIATNGAQGEYFTTTPSFEAPVGSAYDWLNNRIFICRPTRIHANEISLAVWLVE